MGFGSDEVAIAAQRLADTLQDRLLARLAERGWPPLSRSRAAVLRCIDAGVVRPADIARELEVTRQTIQGLLDRLERDGLVERHADTHDRRAQIVEVSARGAALLAGARVLARAVETEVLGTDAPQLRTVLAVASERIRTDAPDR